jgi:hypothetical protein
MEYATDLLFQDVERQGLDSVTLERNKVIAAQGLPDMTAPIVATKKDGTKFVIGLHGPLTPDQPPTEAVRELKEYSATPVILVDEMVVRRNLPTATSELIAKLG